jgi:hypothetical protein
VHEARSSRRVDLLAVSMAADILAACLVALVLTNETRATGSGDHRPFATPKQRPSYRKNHPFGGCVRPSLPRYFGINCKRVGV